MTAYLCKRRQSGLSAFIFFSRVALDTSFDDSVGEVSGTWVLGRPPASEPSLLFYVMVDSVAATIDAIVANGGISCSRSGGMRLRSRRGSATLQEK
jgi:hypothetical protein